MKIAICCDHRGFDLKNKLVEKLLENDIVCDDYGCFSKERCDYPPFAFKVGEAVSNKDCDYGVVICGSGDGVTIASNKVKGIRCVCVKDCEHVIRAKEHVNINVVAFSAEETNVEEAYEMVKALIATPFLHGRYEERIKMIDEYEKRN